MRLYVLLITLSFFLSCANKFNLKAQKENNDQFIRKDLSNYKKATEHKDKKYHSLYNTGNAYYDGRNLILDGRYREAVKILTTDIDSLEYPDRAALWVFICKCKLEERIDAIDFLREYYKRKNTPNNSDKISLFIKYYINEEKEVGLLKKLESIGDLDKCASYYYYGTYKKYYEGDILKGDTYLIKAIETKIYNHSEYMLSEKEIKGFTCRNINQYNNYPLKNTVFSGGKSATKLDENNNNKISNGFINYEDNYKAKVEQFNIDDNKKDNYYFHLPSNLDENKYAVPSEDGTGWEIYNKSETMSVLKKEVHKIVKDIVNEKGYIYVEGRGGKRFFPTENQFELFTITYEELSENNIKYYNTYGLDYLSINQFIKKGDIIAGVKIHCVYKDTTFTDFEKEVYITYNFIFSLNRDRTLEMINRIDRIVDN